MSSHSYRFASRISAGTHCWALVMAHRLPTAPPAREHAVVRPRPLA